MLAFIRQYFRVIVVLFMGAAVGFYIYSYTQRINAEVADLSVISAQRLRILREKKPEPLYAKGLYLTAYSAANEKKRQAIIDLIMQTELNSVVIDIKDYTGNILYDSALDIVNELKTDRDRLINIQSIINDFHEAGIYVIARQTVFQDPALAYAKPEWAIKTSGGGIWRDYKGLSWVDPTHERVWDYNMQIALEAASLGFDEINFDYVRFPSDGTISTAVYANLNESKTITIHNFFVYLHEQLKNEPIYTSLDLFGLVLETHNFDMNIGQRLAYAIDLIDYIYPMTYPSHYPPGHLGMANPAQYPYAVVSNGLNKAESIMASSTTQLRPWLQAFDLGAVYDGTKIREQIRAAEESSLTAGWMLWNASNNYSSNGLDADEPIVYLSD